MPNERLADPNTFDPSKIIVDSAGIYQVIPQRYEWELLDGILHFDRESQLIAAVKHVRQDEWWVRGHLPGRPLLPGVLMVEAAAQLASYGYKRILRKTGFVGFVGIDAAKFRVTISPPAELIIIGKGLNVGQRRAIFATQGFVNGELCFEANVTGMIV